MQLGQLPDLQACADVEKLDAWKCRLRLMLQVPAREYRQAVRALRSFASPWSVERHVQCEECQAMFETQVDLGRHVRLKHARQQALRTRPQDLLLDSSGRYLPHCIACGVSYGDASGLRQHFKHH
eukprot:12472134-Alexandrium_andersonii.AAC.1